MRLPIKFRSKTVHSGDLQGHLEMEENDKMKMDLA
jgi:hypothetical protein